MNDLQLVEKCKNWDLRYFGKLYDRYIDKIYKFVYIKTNNVEISENITSDIFCTVINKIFTLSIKDNISFKSWIYKIAFNKLKDFYKNKKEEVSLDDFFWIKIEENIIENVDNKDYVQKVFNFLWTLKELEREIIILKIWEDLNYKEISDITWKSVDNCKKIVSVGLKTINTNFAITLNKLNDKLKSSLEFKKKLRKKIDVIINNEKKKYFKKKYFFFSVLSFCFAIFWLYYFLWDHLFYNNLINEDKYIGKKSELYLKVKKELEVEKISIKEVDDLEKDIFSWEIEDNQIIDILWDEEFINIIDVFEDADNLIDLTFDDYCEKEWWRIVIVKNDKICKIWTKECNESGFENGVCDFE